MAFPSEKIANTSNCSSSSNSSNGSCMTPNIIILEKIKQANAKKKALLNDQSKEISDKKIEKLYKNNQFSNYKSKKNSLDSSYNKTFNLLKKSIIEEKSYSKQNQEMKSKNLQEKSLIPEVSQYNSNLELYTKGQDNICSLDNDDGNDHNDKAALIKTILHLRKPLLNKGNESIYYDNHGRMEPINWSLVYNKEKNPCQLQNEKKSFNEIKENSESVPEANTEFINFVNNSITPETIFDVEGNIEKIDGPADLLLLKMQRMIKTNIDVDLIVSPEIKKAFEPSEPKIHLINMINQYITKSVTSENNKSESNISEVNENFKTLILNHKNNRFDNSETSLKLKYNDTEQTERLVNTNKNIAIGVSDDTFNFVKLNKSVSSLSLNLSEIPKSDKDARFKHCNKDLLYSKLKQIFIEQSDSSLDLLDVSKENSNQDLSIRSFDQSRQVKENDTANIEFKRKISTPKTELTINENMMKETYTQCIKKFSNNTDLDKKEVKIVNISNEEPFVKSKKSGYFLKLSNLLDKVNVVNEKYKINEIKKKQLDKTEYDQNSYLPVENNIENFSTSIKNPNDCNKDLVLVNTNKPENQSSMSDITLKNNLDLINDTDSEEEFDVVNFENFEPFINLANTLKNILVAEHKVSTDVVNPENNYIASNINEGNKTAANSLSSLSSSFNTKNKTFKNIEKNENQLCHNYNLDNIQKSSNPITPQISKKRKKIIDALKIYQIKNTKDVK